MAGKRTTHLIDWQLYDKQVASGLTQKEIAKKIGIHHVTLSNALCKRKREMELVPLIKDPQALEEYKKNQADVMLEKQRQIIDSISEEDIKKATLQSKATSFAILKDKERLERGLSTSNFSIFCHVSETAEDELTVNDLRA